MFEFISDPLQFRFSRLTDLPERWEEVRPKDPQDILLVQCGENMYWCTDLADLKAIDKVLGRPGAYEVCRVPIVDGMLFEKIERTEVVITKRPRKRMFILPLPTDKSGNTGRELAIIEVEVIRFPEHDTFRYLAPQEYALRWMSNYSHVFPWIETSGPACFLSRNEYAVLVEEAATHSPYIRKWQVKGARARAEDS